MAVVTRSVAGLFQKNNANYLVSAGTILRPALVSASTTHFAIRRASSESTRLSGWSPRASHIAAAIIEFTWYESVMGASIWLEHSAMTSLLGVGCIHFGNRPRS
jgi:hypothetical protein